MATNTLSVEDFLNRPVIKLAKEKAKAFRESGKQVSDIIDADKNQYVDLVQEGGGVLGIALVGYTWAMEESGIRFFSLAGTSAGAINTLLLASKGDISQQKSLKILEELCKQDLFEFVDGNKKIKSIIRSALDSRIVSTILRTVLNIFRITRILRTSHGLNPGNTFQSWIENILEKDEIHTTTQLISLRNKLPAGLMNRNNLDITDLKPKLVIVATELAEQLNFLKNSIGQDIKN